MKPIDVCLKEWISKVLLIFVSNPIINGGNFLISVRMTHLPLVFYLLIVTW